MSLPALYKPDEVAERLGIAERRVRERARELGTCLIMGNRIVLTEEDVLAVMESFRCRSRSTRRCEMDRRTLLKSVAALPAAAMVPTLAVAETLVEPQAPIVPAQLRPYANYVWEWMVSHDGEVYYESFATKEDALEYAKQEEYSIIAECIRQDFDLSVDAYSILERIDDNNTELIGEGEGIQCTSAQATDLEVMVQMAIEAWVVKHNIDLTAWSFGGVRNETDVPETAGLTV